ncbi:unnamed protein product [Soboliphyme baturini]|uniref:Ribose-5-phosphate isomerase n=1 Tax=Soboliphyme baturini TaxID=241478 RepID=A0A183J020_9BILA|nr:unnamed protein product [Soboliphyme baturini]
MPKLIMGTSGTFKEQHMIRDVVDSLVPTQSLIDRLVEHSDRTISKPYIDAVDFKVNAPSYHLDVARARHYHG